MWDAHDGMGWWMLFGGVLWVAFFVGLAFLVATLGSREGRSEPPRPPETPLEIARRAHSTATTSVTRPWPTR